MNIQHLVTGISRAATIRDRYRLAKKNRQYVTGKRPVATKKRYMIGNPLPTYSELNNMIRHLNNAIKDMQQQLRTELSD